MPIFTYVCPEGHREDNLRPRKDRNVPYVCERCEADPRHAGNMMRREGIELQKRPFVVGGTCIVYKS